MRSKKSQITAFMIVGIVLLIVFSFLYYVSTLVNPGVSATTTTQALIKSTVLESYITKCLQRVATDGVSLVGNQGGRVYFERTDRKAGGRNILYGITRVTSLPSAELLALFPFPYYGNDNIPALCDYFGPNKVNSRYQSCKTYSTAGSIQQQLSSYISQNLEKCTKLESLFEGVKQETPSAQVIVGENDMLISLNYPIEYSAGNETFELSKFSYDMGVRLKTFHEFIKSAVYEETMTPDFDISRLNQYNQLPTYKQGFEIRKDSSNPDFDIITATDFASIIDGHAYSFKFARENRAPVITEIKIVKNANSITLTPVIADPDEDDNFVLSLKSLSGMTGFVKLDNEFIWQFSGSNSGQYSVEILAKDTGGLQGSKTVDFRI
jgi:hypothetical protein